MNIRIISRAVVLNKSRNKVLLVRNKDSDFWYPPGGGWNYENEDIRQCAIREALEETGININIDKFLYAQEFHPSNSEIFLEFFWLGSTVESDNIVNNHVDLDAQGIVDSVEWYDKNSIQQIKVFPTRLKDTFWDNQETFLSGEDRFIGVN